MPETALVTIAPFSSHAATAACDSLIVYENAIYKITAALIVHRPSVRIGPVRGQAADSGKYSGSIVAIGTIRAGCADVFAVGKG